MNECAMNLKRISMMCFYKHFCTILAFSYHVNNFVKYFARSGMMFDVSSDVDNDGDSLDDVQRKSLGTSSDGVLGLILRKNSKSLNGDSVAKDLDQILVNLKIKCLNDAEKVMPSVSQASSCVSADEEEDSLNFVIDKVGTTSFDGIGFGGADLSASGHVTARKQSDSILISFGGVNTDDRTNVNKVRNLCSAMIPGIDVKAITYFDLDVLDTGELNSDLMSRRFAEKLDRQQEMFKKAVITGDFQKRQVLSSYDETDKVLKHCRKTQRKKTSGQYWYDLPATEMTEEHGRDLEIIQMRDSLDPKRRYRSNDRSVIPKYFQIGTVMDNSTDIYQSRIPKRDRKYTIVDELLSDADLRRYHKRKYSEIMAEQLRSRKGAFTKCRLSKAKRTNY